MKNFYSFLLGGIGFFAFAQQPVVSPANPTINDAITITYGPDANNNWTYLDPQGDSVLYLYLGLDTNNNVADWEYNDKWDNCSASNLIPMPYNSATGKYEAIFDLRTHFYDGTGGYLNVGDTVYNGQFVIRREKTYECAPTGATLSSWQGENKSFGIVSAVVLGTSDIKRNAFGAKISGGKLYIEKTGNYNIKIYDASGRILKDFNLKNNQSKSITPLNITSNGFNFCVIEDQNGEKQSLKFIN